MIWLLYILIIIFIVWFSFKILPKIREKIRPNLEDLKDLCPHCNEEVEKNRRYCMACGGQIWTNVISEDKD
jgi:predicted amidophosphoribosyltransferase|tara:strand:- start:222 stop:434 length:213 start_codon:yes stop_codon:yes gene_type:complete